MIPVLCTLLISCGPKSTQQSINSEAKANKDQDKISVEAYLFDAKLRRKGKPTSVRLEVYQTDSLLGLSGRAYLGKSALKGKLTKDSLVLLFPASGEYLQDEIATVLASLPCEVEGSSLDLFQLFSSLPDSISLDSSVLVSPDYSDANKPRFQVSVDGCQWEIKLQYDWKKHGFRLREFEYQSGDGTSLRATRREYRSNAKVKHDRLGVTIPPTAVRISL